MCVGGMQLKFIINKAAAYTFAVQKHVDIEFCKIAPHNINQAHFQRKQEEISRKRNK